VSSNPKNEDVGATTSAQKETPLPDFPG
jgi:hypothetical protein